MAPRPPGPVLSRQHCPKTGKWGDEEGVPSSDVGLTAATLPRENRKISGCPQVPVTDLTRNQPRFRLYSLPILQTKQTPKTASNRRHRSVKR